MFKQPRRTITVSQTRQSSAAKMIRWLAKVNHLQTPNLESKFNKIKALLAADPGVMYEMTEVTFNGEPCTLSPLQYSCGTLDFFFHQLFFAAAFRSNTLEQFDDQVLQCNYQQTVDEWFLEYDNYYHRYEAMPAEGVAAAEISSEAVAMLGSAQRSYPRCLWDDIVSMKTAIKPVFKHTIEGKDLADSNGQDVLGKTYYVFIAKEYRFDPNTEELKDMAVPTVKEQMPPSANDILLQRDIMIEYMQVRLDARNQLFRDAKRRKDARDIQAMMQQDVVDKENQTPALHN